MAKSSSIGRLRMDARVWMLASVGIILLWSLVGVADLPTWLFELVVGACVRSPDPRLARVMLVADIWPERAEPAPSS